MHADSFVRHYRNTFKRKEREFNHSFQLPDYFAEMIGDKKEVRIAEVGCALVNTIGDTWPNTTVRVYCSDKHASEFNKIWQENGVAPYSRIEYQDVESLTYPTNFFDIVHCRNTLDHTEDPVRAIEELKRVSKEWVYLAHAENQMDRFGGHHYWNVRYENGECMFYGKEYSFVVDGETSFDGELVIVKIRV